ncbi:MAG: tetraacyldisaccharide 4'-kinase [Syntrophorhabdaceae bacterium]|nr:tetraacyldisaccharide 4'-kinase [Syntrophorhabdaceae bacterium]
MRNAIIRVWSGEGSYISWLLWPLLFPLSLIYKVCLKVIDFLYRKGIKEAREAPIPVISVGNITLGGTGKTPVVEKLSLRLKEMGFNPGIITRGYMRKRKGTFSVDIERDSATEVGDEAYMLAKKTKLPVLVGNDKGEAIGMGIREFDIDVALIDDGFQTKNIKKDMEILILDGGRREKRPALFPLGPYREPVERICDADVLILKNGSLDETIGRYADGIPVYPMRFRPLYLYNMKRERYVHHQFIKNRAVLAFSGLGNNRSFFDLLRDIGALVVKELSFPDHHDYSERDLRHILSYRDIDFIITTEKDGVKVSRMDLPENLFCLAIEPVIEKEEDLLKNITQKIEITKRLYDGRGGYV